MRFLLEGLKSKLREEWQEGIDFVERERLPNKRRALIYLEKLALSLGERPDWLDSEYLSHLLTLFSYSNYLADFLTKNPEKLKELKEIYRKRFKPEDFRFEVKEKDKRKVKGELLSYKNLQMARVVLRDILSLAPFTELVRDTTLIHDSITSAALKYLKDEFEKKYGKPSCGFVVIDMGKAAAFELNYSSDLDLMFVYESRFGETEGGSVGKLQNHDYFTLLAQELVSLLEGVFVVDTRLRPNGTMGPLVNDILALEEYYTAVARPWERFALLKARPSVGDVRAAGLEFLKLAKAFVYRKYVDLTLIEEVLRLKELIRNKVLKKKDKIDLKLGRGGIREVEFIVQAFQLIYGGKHREIRSPHTLTALRKLHRWGYLTDKEYSELQEAYLFLRRAEHMLQITNFRQTQTFHPESEEAEELAKKMGFDGREEFLKELRRHAERVNYYFNKFFPTGDRKPLSTYTEEELAKMGFVEPAEVKRFIDVLLSMKSLTPEEVNRIDVMGELFLRLLFDAPSSKNAMKNLVNFLEREEGRVFFFSILNQLNALNLLFYLLSTKDFFITRFRQTPELVDYIFHPRLIEEGVKEEQLRELMESLGNLQLVKNIFEVVALLRYRLGRVEIVDFFGELTAICDFVLGELYGELSPSFCLSSLGKHGSREMNVGSDLDLLFFREGGEPEEDKAVKLIKELEELGYEVDTRLRPFGEKGELVFTLNYFKEYLRESARVWERLAFTRFRFLLGGCRDEVEEIVREFLFGEPLNERTLTEIERMRERLERELGKGKKDIKYAAGGVVDLEFIAYTYQLLRGKWLRNTYLALKELSLEAEPFSTLPELYLELRRAETEKRLFGDFIFYGAKIEPLKRRVREGYLEFMKWCRREISPST
ncbi:[protein-PII] uridylyltransferase family protein [Thermovibrio sp.]